MIVYLLPDGRKAEGNDATDIVRQMNRSKMRRARNLSRYRCQVARRVKELTGVEVETDSDEAFLDSLEQHNLVTKLATST